MRFTHLHFYLIYSFLFGFISVFIFFDVKNKAPENIFSNGDKVCHIASKKCGKIIKYRSDGYFVIAFYDKTYSEFESEELYDLEVQ